MHIVPIPVSFQVVRSFSSHVNSNLKTLLETMLKTNNKNIAEKQLQGTHRRERPNNNVCPSRISLQVLGTGATGAPKSLYMFTDHSRYLFNCGEGTQRLAHEHKMKLSKLEHIFVTQAIWSNIGGLPGVALTIQDVGVPEIHLHGPSGLDELFVATKRFVVLKDLMVKMAECNENNYFEDNVMRITYVPIEKSLPSNENLHAGASVEAGGSMKRRRSKSRSPSAGRTDEEDDIDYYAHERKHCRSRRRRSKSRSSSVSGTRTAPTQLSNEAKLHLHENKNKETCMSYICKIHPRPGALNLDKCVKAGVPPGPLLGRLKGGEDIRLPTGIVVKSSDVCEPDEAGPVFIVVDCSSEDHLPSLLENEEFKKLQSSCKIDTDLAYLVVHFTPQNIIQQPRYQEWVNRFSPSTHHLVLNSANTCMGSAAVHRVQNKLNLVHERFFPLLGDNGTEQMPNENETSNKRLKTENGSYVHLDNKPNKTTQVEMVHPGTLCAVQLRGTKGVDCTGELKLTPQVYIDETIATVGFTETLDQFKKEINERQASLIIQEYPKILFLGTGSCIPNKTRNVSSILIQVSETSNILLDCGEGSYGQLVRFYGQELSAQILGNVKGIYISHLHADHHLGLVGFLQGRRLALKKLGIDRPPVVLFAPKEISTWLNFYDSCFESVLNEFELIPNQDVGKNGNQVQDNKGKRLWDDLDLITLDTVLVKHCPNAFGVSLTTKNGNKITYSGDTMPCESLIKLGIDSDLLIHEATMEDELEQEASKKLHSTTSQAIQVGRRMRAKQIILTHFSQRYAKLPRINENFTDVGIAFDNLQVSLSEVSLLSLMNPVLKIVFSEHVEDLEAKALKRHNKEIRARTMSK